MDLRTYGYRGPEALEMGVPARVVAVHRERYAVVSESGEGFARLKAAAYRGAAPQDRPTVGDFVALIENPGGDGWIVRTLPRRSCFSRSNLAGHAAQYVKHVREQLVAANFDYVFLVQSLNHDFNLRRMERYLALAAGSGAQPVAVLTKLDLCPQPQAYLDRVRAFLGSVPALALSAATGEGMAQLAPYLAPGTTLALLGSSGVGKSSLVNALAGEAVMSTGAIREEDSRGRHTTTRRQLVRLPCGALMIDTPGMRELGVLGDPEGVSASFPEIEALAARCRFSNCTHQSEPACAVRAALESGDLSQEKWNLYRQLLRESDFVRRHVKKDRR